MALRFIDETPSFGERDDLPWISEYNPDDPLTGGKVASPVQKLIFGAKGCLVLATDYKSFLFKESKIYAFMQDAVKYWKEDPKNSAIPGLFLCTSSKNSLAFDDDIQDCFVEIESEKVVRIHWGKPPKASTTKNSPSPNPFLSKVKK